jgi:putative membrane protein
MNVFKLTVAAAVAAFLAFSHSGYAQDKAAKAKAKLSGPDQQALTRLVQGDRAEIAAGKLALKKGTSPEVKQFGEHMVSEHTRMLQKGAALAKAKGVKAPAGPDAKQQAALKKLEKLSGDAFDREFAAQMMKDHEAMLAVAAKAADGARDGDLKNHASQGRSAIMIHLEKARALQAALGASVGASAKPAAKKK